MEALDALSQPPAGNSGYLTCDSQANSDYDETDAEGEAYTDQELDEPYEEQALARSSEPADQSHKLDLSERVAAALAYPIDQVRRSKGLCGRAAGNAGLVEPGATLGMLREGRGCCHKMAAMGVWAVTKHCSGFHARFPPAHLQQRPPAHVSPSLKGHLMSGQKLGPK